MGKCGILIVDDAKEVRFLAKKILASKGYPVFGATSGKEAISVLHERTDIGIVILDVFLPDMDAFEVLESIKQCKKERGFKVCIISARKGSDIAAKAKQGGAEFCLFKPLLPASLLDLAARLSESREGEI